MPPFINEQKSEKGSHIFENRHLLFGILAIFFYVGSEVSIGSWLGTFARQEDIMAMDEETANYFLAFFWGGLMIGRLMASTALNRDLSKTKRYLLMALTSISIFCLIWLITAIHLDFRSAEMRVAFKPISIHHIWYYLIFMAINFFAFIAGKGNPSRMIVIFCVINSMLLLIGMLSKGELAFWAIIGTGLFFSIGWSNIFSLSIKGLGAQTSQASSLLVMAIVGGAVLPFIQSNIIENVSVQASFVIPLAGMIYLIFFGIQAT